MKKLDQTIVVEGRADAVAVSAVFDCDIIITHGFKLTKNTQKDIAIAANKRGIIILTDPDYAGEQIRKKIKEIAPNAVDAHIPKDEALKDGDIGVENAPASSIHVAIEKATKLSFRVPVKMYKSISLSLLMCMGLVGHNSKFKRDYICNRLGFGSCNVKNLLKKLERHGVSEEELIKIMGEMDGL